MSIDDINKHGLLKKINELKEKHESLKKELTVEILELKEKGSIIDRKMALIDKIEKEYVELVEKLYNNNVTQ